MPPWVWIVFVSVLLVVVAMDQGLLSRQPRVQSRRSALVSLGIWAFTALCFAGGLYFVYEGHLAGLREALTAAGAVPAPGALPADNALPADIASVASLESPGLAAMLQFLTGFAVELVLSLDNLAVLAVIFAFYKVPAELISRVMFLGVLTALLLRLGMILLGGWMLAALPWATYFMGTVLVLAVARVLVMPGEGTDLSKRPANRLLRRLFPEAQGSAPGTVAAPLLLVALAAGIADVTYAADSIPAVLSITRDPFIAFTSNAFAILMLRSLYVALHGVVGRFRYLRVSVVLVLCFLASKYFLGAWSRSATEVSLALVLVLLALGVGASLLHAWGQRRAAGGIGPPASAAGTRPDGAAPPVIEDIADVVEIAQANLWKFIVLVVGLSVAVFGALVIGPLPGPGGVFVVAAGLGILATEFVWAQRLLREVKRRAEQLSETTDKVAAQTPKWVVVPIVLGYVTFFALLFLAVRRFEITWIPELLIIFTGAGGLFPLGFWVYRTLRARRAPPAPPEPARPAPETQAGPQPGNDSREI